MVWPQAQPLPAHSYVCGYCNHKVGAHLGWHHGNYGTNVCVYICPHCDKPSYFDKNKGERMPGTTYGQDVEGVPDDLSALYNEARRCYSINAFTAAVLLCRKLLMNIAVSLKAPIDKPFIAHVEYLAANGYVPPNGKGWVDHIRKRGNEATHDIVVMTEGDARDLIGFSEMLLKFIYEFPSRVPANS